MNEFVEECRREWRRLDVPDAVAAEMAGDLAADLEEAEADGVSPEEVLGSGALDPRSFAKAWAVERGVIGRTSPSTNALSRRLRIPAAIGALALVALVGAVLVFLEELSPPARQALLVLPPPASSEWMVVTPDGFVADAPFPPTVSVGVGSDDDTISLAGVLLTAALVGIVLVTLSWFWTGRRSRVDYRPGGPAY